VDIPTLLYIHGSGGGPEQFASFSAWTEFRDWLIDHGWAWVEGGGDVTDAAGQQNWGNAGSRTAYQAYLTHVGGILDIGDLVVMGRSMGGITASWLFTMSPIAGNFVGAIFNSAVSTLFTGEAVGPSIGLPTGVYFGSNVYTAHGVADYAELVSTKQAFAPETWAPSVWTGKKILHMYGTADTSVPWYPRGGSAMRDLWAGLPAVDRINVRDGGDHSAGNGSFLEVSAMTSFLQELHPVVPIVTAKGWRTRAHFLIKGGERYVMQPLR
jgi:pimeloyl-ACP methyl ester carboxylesterase